MPYKGRKIKRVLNSVNLRGLLRLLKGLYHRKGPGRRPYNPLSMLKAQLLKHLLRIPSDRRLALRLKHDREAARACRFRLGEAGLEEVGRAW